MVFNVTNQLTSRVDDNPSCPLFPLSSWQRLTRCERSFAYRQSQVIQIEDEAGENHWRTSHDEKVFQFPEKNAKKSILKEMRINLKFCQKKFLFCFAVTRKFLNDEISGNPGNEKWINVLGKMKVETLNFLEKCSFCCDRIYEFLVFEKFLLWSFREPSQMTSCC